MDNKRVENNFENNVISLEGLKRIKIREIRVRQKEEISNYP